MNKLTTIVLCTVALVTAATAQTQSADSASQIYLRPAVITAFPGHFNTAAGGAIALGAIVEQVHSLEVQGIRFTTEDHGAKVTFTPVLVNYDYHYRVNAPLSFTLGASAGVTYQAARWWWYRDTAKAFTYGFRAGVDYKLTKRVSVNGDVTSLRLDDTRLVTKGNIAIVSVGLTYRF